MEYILKRSPHFWLPYVLLCIQQKSMSLSKILNSWGDSVLLQAEASLAQVQVQVQARVMGTELELHADFYHRILYTRLDFRQLLSHNSYKAIEAW